MQDEITICMTGENAASQRILLEDRKVNTAITAVLNKAFVS